MVTSFYLLSLLLKDFIIVSLGLFHCFIDMANSFSFPVYKMKYMNKRNYDFENENHMVPRTKAAMIGHRRGGTGRPQDFLEQLLVYEL